MGAIRNAKPAALQTDNKQGAYEATVQKFAANEFVFAVVGPAGSGPGLVAQQLETLLEKKGYPTTILKASHVITKWALAEGREIPSQKNLLRTESMQDIGDDLRANARDNSIVAVELIKQIRIARAARLGIPPNGVVEPDGSPRAFILDSIRHPAEVALLRKVYQDAFCLVGIVCHEDERAKRLRSKYRESGDDQLQAFMQRDENAPEAHGQKVADAFHLADYFIDNSAPRLREQNPNDKESNPKWDIPEQLGRLVDIMTYARIVRPRSHETGMFHAYGARMRSSCLSRQVGAALIGHGGDLIATGTNEVPRAGGGTYGPHATEGLDDDPSHDEDFRCFASNKYCSNTKHRNIIIKELMSEVSAFQGIEQTDAFLEEMRRTRIGQLIEFSRAVHAEMDALLSAARSGVSTVASRLFVTTFPCHSCARHIVAAGVAEVQYIEPYFKSRAIELHGDAITTNPEKWVHVPTAGRSTLSGQLPKVLFRPFTGVAPRLYRRAFYKDRPLKDDATGMASEINGALDGPATAKVLRVSYAQVEARLAGALEGE